MVQMYACPDCGKAVPAVIGYLQCHSCNHLNEVGALQPFETHSLVDLNRIARGAARAQMRKQGIDPSKASPKQALAVLDDMLRSNPMLLASIWYQATEYNRREHSKFGREWMKERGR